MYKNYIFFLIFLVPVFSFVDAAHFRDDLSYRSSSDLTGQDSTFWESNLSSPVSLALSIGSSDSSLKLDVKPVAILFDKRPTEKERLAFAKQVKISQIAARKADRAARAEEEKIRNLQADFGMFIEAHALQLGCAENVIKAKNKADRAEMKESLMGALGDEQSMF